MDLFLMTYVKNTTVDKLKQNAREAYASRCIGEIVEHIAGHYWTTDTTCTINQR